MDVEVGKVNNKCEVLQQWNNTLEEDKRNLVNQVSVLLTQYHELLSQTLEEKDHFHEETKNFSDKLNNLKRQKEILEDKIMEQYRRMENSTPLKKNSKASAIGALFVRKMRRASSELISRVPTRSRSRSRGPLGSDRDSPDQQDGPDTFSLESGSHSGSNSGCGSIDGGSGGEGDMTPTGGGGGASRSRRELIRQSMPIINYDHQSETASLRNSFSSETLCLPSINSSNSSDSRDRNSNSHSHSQTNGYANVANQSNNQVNGNSPQPSGNGNGSGNGNSPTATPSAIDSLNSSLVSSNSMGSVNCSLNSGGAPTLNHQLWNSSLSAVQSPVSFQPAKLQTKPNGLALDRLSLNGLSTSLQLNKSPIALKRFNQPTRSLALLERAGSRVPLCIGEMDPDSVVLMDPAGLDEEPDTVPTRDFGPQANNILVARKASFESPHGTPRNSSPANSDGSDGSGRAQLSALAKVGQQTTGPSPPPSLAPPQSTSTPNNTRLTSTTHINVNITTAAGPSGAASSLERRGSFRVPPRPAPRIPAASFSSDCAIPPLPARSSNIERPALPPRQSSSIVEEKSPAAPVVAAAATPASSGDGPAAENGSAPAANSIWYEYGCV